MLDTSKSVFAAQDVEISYKIAGIVPITIKDIADGDAIRVTRNVDLATLRVGMQGAGGIAISANRSGMVTISILLDSPTDQSLNNLLNGQTVAGSSLNFATLSIRNTKTGTQINGEGVFFQKQPDYSLNTDNYPIREWNFLCISLVTI